MSFFSASNDDDPVSDQVLLHAMRKRLLGEIQGREAASIINNVYGSGPSSSGGDGVGGVMGMLGAQAPGSPADDPFDYFVDITRKDLPKINKATGKPEGWEKSVHRYRHEKKKGR